MCCLSQIPLENKSIFSGSFFQNIEENKKWKNRFFFVPDSYNINYYDNKSVRQTVVQMDGAVMIDWCVNDALCFSTQSFDKRLHPKGTINCAGYKVLTSIEEYLDLISNSLPGK